MRCLRGAVPLDYREEIDREDVYGRGGAHAASIEFKMPRPVIALDGEHTCFVIADYADEQVGLFGERIVLQCQHFEHDPEAPGTPPNIPDDAGLVSVCKIYAKEVPDFGRVQYEGDVGYTFVASKRKGMVMDPREMQRATLARAETIADPQERIMFLTFGPELTLRAAVGALERVVHVTGLGALTEHPPVQAVRGKVDRLLRWEERPCLRI